LVWTSNEGCLRLYGNSQLILYNSPRIVAAQPFSFCTFDVGMYFCSSSLLTNQVKYHLLSFLLILSVKASLAQSVGVVLSGGGATALTHIGFLKALEDNEIPIDYIGGTSMGSLIAALYASGYSIAEIDSMARSEKFQEMVTGYLSEDFRYYFKDPDPNASMATIKYSQGKLMTNALPSNLIDPVGLDWNLMELFAQADAASGGNFDSLMVPFRCIAADVKNKKEVLFKSGPLNVATRASSTYPFYLPPRRVDGVLLYDGGLYNNFPTNVIYHEFLPDVIIGCNVSGDNGDPHEDDILSQLESMILYRNLDHVVCDQIVIVQPNAEEIGTFDFNRIPEAIEIGYKATMDSLGSIMAMVERRETFDQKQEKRQKFRSRLYPLMIQDVTISGLEKGQRFYIKKMIGKDYQVLPLHEMKKSYFKIFGDDKVKSIFPTTSLDPLTKRFNLNLEVEKEKDLFVSFGGNFSSRSINTGFVGLRYNLFGTTSSTITANSYFGRFYASLHGAVRWDIPGRVPFSIEGAFTQNRWDYYKSLATFFDDVKPSFILLNERFGSLAFTIPTGNKSKFRIESSYAYMFDEYYQTQQFLSTDTADRTDFDAIIFRGTWTRSTLNRAQFPSSGTSLLLTGKYVFGEENTYPGTTSSSSGIKNFHHDWFVAKFQYINYFIAFKKYHGGMHIEHVYSNMEFFSNYISSVIMAPAFQPIPESKTFFMPQFRAHNYSALGFMNVLALGKNVDLRAEAYVYSSFNQIVSDTDSHAQYLEEWRPYFLGSSALIYHSPLGPVSFQVNYYEQSDDPWSVLFNFGWIVFNRSARD
jgi:NTE family protein